MDDYQDFHVKEEMGSACSLSWVNRFAILEKWTNQFVVKGKVVLRDVRIRLMTCPRERST